MKKQTKFGWLDFILGLLFIILGCYTFAHPSAALSGLVVLYSTAVIISGIMDIVFYAQLHRYTGTGSTVTLVSGIINVLAGISLLLNPFLGKWIFSIVFPVWCIAHSISRLANQRVLRTLLGKGHARVHMIFNIFGIVLGIAMFINPFISTMSLGYVVALGMLLNGAGCIIEAFSVGNALPNETPEIEYVYTITETRGYYNE